VKITKECSADVEIGTGSAEDLFNALVGVVLPKSAELIKVREGRDWDHKKGEYNITRWLHFEWKEEEEL
jgi:hypothetical protein